MNLWPAYTALVVPITNFVTVLTEYKLRWKKKPKEKKIQTWLSRQLVLYCTKHHSRVNCRVHLKGGTFSTAQMSCHWAAAHPTHSRSLATHTIGGRYIWEVLCVNHACFYWSALRQNKRSIVPSFNGEFTSLGGWPKKEEHQRAWEVVCICAKVILRLTDPQGTSSLHAAFPWGRKQMAGD